MKQLLNHSPGSRKLSVLVLLLLLASGGRDLAGQPGERQAPVGKSPGGKQGEEKQGDPFADRVVKFERGEGAGYGIDRLPDVVLGAPRGGGRLAPSGHVVSLGGGGSITLEFVDNEVVDEEGIDLLVFENPFLKDPGDDPRDGFFELAKVEVSFDGETWKEFPHDPETRAGCAGWHPVLANVDENDIPPTDPKRAGGDPFDLAEVGLKAVRFIRITDLDNTRGSKGTAGFDLDAVAAVHSRPRD